MKSVWNTADVLPDIDDSMSTSHGYTSSDLIIVYKKYGEEYLGIGWYSETGGFHVNGEEQPVNVVIWTYYPNDIWRKMEVWPV